MYHAAEGLAAGTTLLSAVLLGPALPVLQPPLLRTCTTSRCRHIFEDKKYAEEYQADDLEVGSNWAGQLGSQWRQCAL